MILIVSSLLMCASCKHKTSTENEPEIQNGGNEVDMTDEGEKVPDEPVEDEEDTKVAIKLDYAYDFSENIAWVKYKAFNDYGEEVESGIGLLNTDGAITRTTLPERGSCFNGGYSYINYQNDGKQCFMIVDTSGNIITQSNTDAEYSIICGGDDRYLVKKMIRTMDVNADFYGIIDTHGTWIYEPTGDFMFGYQQGTQIMYDNGPDYYYLGNGYFQAIFSDKKKDIYGYTGDRLHVILDAKEPNNQLIELPYSTSSSWDDKWIWVEGVCDGAVIWDDEHYLYRLNDDGSSTEIFNIEGCSLKLGNGAIFLSLDDGKSARFIDGYGNIIADFSEYVVCLDDLYDIYDDYRGTIMFKDGYAAVIIYGKNDPNNSRYIQIIDTNGKCAFEPIQITNTWRFIDGKALCQPSYGNLCWVDYQGNITECTNELARDLLRDEHKTFSCGYTPYRPSGEEYYMFVSTEGEYLDVYFA